MELLDFKLKNVERGREVVKGSRGSSQETRSKNVMSRLDLRIKRNRNTYEHQSDRKL